MTNFYYCTECGKTSPEFNPCACVSKNSIAALLKRIEALEAMIEEMKTSLKEFWK